MAPNPNWPTVAVEICFNVDPFDTAPPAAVWTDVTNRVTAMSWSRGRQYELDQVQGGQASFTVLNDDGALDPANTASAYYPNVKLYRQIRVRATWAGTAHTVFTGYVERWPQRWEANGVQQWTDLVAVDGLAMLMGELQTLYACAVLLDNPSGYYPLSDPAGSTAVAELSGRGSSGELVPAKYGPGTATFGGEAPYATDGDTSVGLTQGNPGDLSATPMTALRLDPASVVSTYTLEAWVKTSAPPASQALLVEARPAAAGVSGQGQLYIGSDGKAHFARLAMSPFLTGRTAHGVTNICDGRWHHVVGTATTTTVVVYVDGVADGTVTGAAQTDSTVLDVAWAGGVVDPATRTGSYALTGSLARVAVYQGALSAARVASHYSAGAAGFAGEDTGARIARILGYAGWTGATSIDVGSSTLQSAAGIAGQQPADALREAATSENGLVYVNGAGHLVFANRHSRYNATAAYTFGEAGLPYADVRPDFDPARVANQVTVSRPGGLTTRFVDTASINAYGPRPLQQSLNITSDAEVVDAANYLLARYKQPVTRLSGLVIDAASNTALWPAALTVDVGTRIATTRDPAWGAALSYGLWVESLSVDVAYDDQGAHWRCTYVCSPADVDTYLVWNGSGAAGQWDNARWSY